MKTWMWVVIGVAVVTIAGLYWKYRAVLSNRDALLNNQMAAGNNLPTSGGLITVEHVSPKKNNPVDGGYLGMGAKNFWLDGFGQVSSGSAQVNSGSAQVIEPGSGKTSLEGSGKASN